MAGQRGIVTGATDVPRLSRKHRNTISCLSCREIKSCENEGQCIKGKSGLRAVSANVPASPSQGPTINARDRATRNTAHQTTSQSPRYPPRTTVFGTYPCRSRSSPTHGRPCPAAASTLSSPPARPPPDAKHTFPVRADHPPLAAPPIDPYRASAARRCVMTDHVSRMTRLSRPGRPQGSVARGCSTSGQAPSSRPVRARAESGADWPNKYCRCHCPPRDSASSAQLLHSHQASSRSTA